VLVFLPGPLPSLQSLLEFFDQMGLQEGQAEDVQEVALLGPVDHAKIPRWPAGQLEWKTSGPNVVGYVVESQFGQLGRENWSSSSIRPVPPAVGAPSIEIRIPFGSGQQPHRWRVWAIGKTGVISISEWRTVDFTS
jgi:hypothetical protein